MAKKRSSPKKSSPKPAKQKSGQPQLKAAAYGAIWPEERDVMFRPDRLKYVRKLIKADGCVFCAAAKAGPSFESLCLFKNKFAMVVLNKFPYNGGHLLVLPTRHTGDFASLKSEEGAEIHRIVQASVGILGKVYNCEGFNVGLNLGAAAGAGIPDHLHYHIVPRWWGDTNFFPLLADTKVIVETLEQTFERLLPYYESL